MTADTSNDLKSKYEFSLIAWIFSSFFASGILIGGEAFLLGGNLWPITGALGAFGGLFVGIISGVVLKFLKVSYKARNICFVILYIVPVLWMYLAVKKYVLSI